MNRSEVLSHYRLVSTKLLTMLLKAAQGMTLGHSPALKVSTSGQDASGNVLSDGIVTIESQVVDNTSWLLTFGWSGTGQFDDSIDWAAPRNRFPSFQVPVTIRWIGFDRWGARTTPLVQETVIRVSQEQVEYGGVSWPTLETARVDSIVRDLVDKWLVYPGPDEAVAASPDGRWETLDERAIAARGQGTIWRVRDRLSPNHRELFALKKMRWMKKPSTTAYRRFLQEIEITTKLASDSPGIVPVVDSRIPTDAGFGEPFYVMPLASSSLDKARIFAGNLELVLSIALQISKTLQAVHRAGVIHRDIKPANILLFGEELRPAIADFGICYLISEEDPSGRLTHTDASTVGSEDYVAPELQGGRLDEVDGRVDIYSLGKTLYFALSGGEVFPRWDWDDDRFDLRKRESDARLDHFYGLLKRMVTRQPSDRFQTMEECVTAVSRAIENVRNGIHYDDEMYGRSPSGSELALQLMKALRTQQGSDRERTVRRALRVSRETMEAIGANDGVRFLTPASATRLQEPAALGAEAFLASGLPLVVAGELVAFRKWLGQVFAVQRGTFNPETDAERSVWVGSASVGLFGAGIVAWEEEKTEILASAISEYGINWELMTFLNVGGRFDEPSWDWILETLQQSNVLLKLDPFPLSRLNSLAAVIAGLGVIRIFKGLSDKQLAETQEADSFLSSLAGIISHSWISDLPRTFLESPDFAEKVAVHVYGMTQGALRQDCKRLTPTIRALILRRYASKHRSVSWGYIDQEGLWTKWCD